jgi:hypothetical protein
MNNAITAIDVIACIVEGCAAAHAAGGSAGMAARNRMLLTNVETIRFAFSLLALNNSK